MKKENKAYLFHQKSKPNINGNVKEDLVFRSYTYSVDDNGADKVGYIYIYTTTKVVGFDWEKWGFVRYSDKEIVRISYDTQEQKQKQIKFLKEMGAKESK